MRVRNNPFEKESTYKRAFFWNMMGSGLNAVASMIMLLATTRLVGTVQGGIFSIGFAIASLVWSFASYETNTFHVTDGKNEYSHENFFQVKILLCFVALAASIGYLIIKEYEINKAIVALLLCLYKITDAFSGFFYGMFQKQKRLDISGYSYFIRILLSLIAFCGMLIIKKDLILAIFVAWIIEILWILVYEIPLGKVLVNYKAKFEWGKIKSIFVNCFPLFSASFVLMYINNVPKYAIDRILNEQLQNIFGIIFMPAAIINLLGLFIFRPLLTTLVRYWRENNIKSMLNLCGRCFGGVLVITVLCVGAAYICGIPLLELLYGIPLVRYKMALVIVMVAGGFNACVSFLYNILVVTRRQIYILIAYLPALVLALAVSNILISRYEVLGASVVYLVSIICICIILSIIVLNILMKQKTTTINK